ncbi:MAG: hypothetical protein ABUL54_07485 [Dongia sp.]
MTQMFRLLAAAILAALLTAFASGATGTYSGANGKALYVAKEDWAFYKEYLGRISSTNPGTFIMMARDDHTVGSTYSYCGSGNCRVDTYISGVMAKCHDMHVDCIVFARSSSIEVNYKLEE